MNNTSRRRFTKTKASHYIIAILIITSWIMIGMKIHVARKPTAEAAAPTEVQAVMQTLHTTPPQITNSALLWLVNQDNPLPLGYTPNNLVSHQGIRLQAPAYTAYNQMLTAMKADGILNLQLASAYRPYDYQQNLFNKKIRALESQGHNTEDATQLAAETIQRPGSSEHQTGLALDVTVSGDLTQAFASTPAGVWIAENSHRFGFIIRYPQAKTEITHIIYEPWHLRYVGVPHSTIMYENNLTLEEYAHFIADAGTYMAWEEPGIAFFIVTYSHIWPEIIPQGLVDISSISPGDGVGYIITIRREYHLP